MLLLIGLLVECYTIFRIGHLLTLHVFLGILLLGPVTLKPARTAPIEVASGKRKVNRLSRRGNRRVNHAIHMAAVTQVRQKHSEGRACYDKKLAEGKTHREAYDR